MTEPLRIGVMGAGSIGCFVGGKLLAANAAEVVFVGRARLRDELAEHGLRVKDFDSDASAIPPERVVFATDVSALAEVDAVLCCVKSPQTEEVARALAGVLRAEAVVASLQNGVRNPEVLRAHLPGHRVLGAIVGFNVVSRGDGLFHRAMSGSLLLEQPSEPGAHRLVDALTRARLDVETRADLRPDLWTKLLVNLNNAVSALSGAPTRTLLLTPGYRRVVAAVIAEALSVLQATDIRPAKLRGIPVGLMPFILRLPTPLVRLVTRAQMRVDPEARSSMWEDLTRGRPTEVDFLNGEIVRLAARVGATAPLNARIVELVHDAEQSRRGSPELEPGALWAALTSPATAPATGEAHP